MCRPRKEISIAEASYYAPNYYNEWLIYALTIALKQKAIQCAANGLAAWRYRYRHAPHSFSCGWRFTRILLVAEFLALGLCSLPPPAAAVRRDWARRIFSHVKLLLSYPLIQEPTMSSPPDFSKEDLKGTPAEFAPGAWVLGHAHFAGGAIVQKLMF